MDLLFKVKSEEETEQVLKSKNASLLTESDSFLENYVYQSRPLLLKLGCSEVASKWTTDYLQKTTQDGLEVDSSTSSTKVSSMQHISVPS